MNNGEILHLIQRVRYHGRWIEIDNDILPLIKALWSEGYETTHCCQGDPDVGSKPGNLAYVSFANEIDAMWLFSHLRENFSKIRLSVGDLNTSISFNHAKIEDIALFVKNHPHGPADDE